MDVDQVDEMEIRELIEQRAQPLLALADYLAHCPTPRETLTRPFVGDLLSHSMQVEEFLDTLDAGKCCDWCNMRSVTAAIKLFADASYELLHIQQRVPRYHLMPVERDFVAATNEALEFTSVILARAAKEMLEPGPRAGSASPLRAGSRQPAPGTAAQGPAAARLPGPPGRYGGGDRHPAGDGVPESRLGVRGCPRHQPHPAAGIRRAQFRRAERRAAPEPRIPVPQPAIPVRHVRLGHASGASGYRSAGPAGTRQRGLPSAAHRHAVRPLLRAARQQAALFGGDLQGASWWSRRRCCWC